jgi:hypothetical protein
MVEFSKPEKFVARENEALITKYNQIRENIVTRSSYLVDARPKEAFQPNPEGVWFALFHLHGHVFILNSIKYYRQNSWSHKWIPEYTIQ